MAREIKRYSTAFKQKVVSEIESGRLNVSQAQKIYQITGGQTVQNWIKKFGKLDLLNTIVRIEMKDEKDRVKELEKQLKELKIAYAEKQLETRILETLLECANEHYKTDLKKNFGTAASEELKKKTGEK